MSDVRVVKLGGSIISARQFNGSCLNWLLDQPCELTIVITGGGVWADQVRRLSRDRGMTEWSAHWLAVRAMSLTAWLVAAVDPRAEHVAHADVFEDRGNGRSRFGPKKGRFWLFDVAPWLAEEESRRLPDRLPIGWHVTSDSIAAHFAYRVGAAQLVLVKSCLPRGRKLEDWVTESFVDEYFPAAAARLPSVRVFSWPEGLSVQVPRES